MTSIGVIDEREMHLPLSAAQLGVWFARGAPGGRCILSHLGAFARDRRFWLEHLADRPEPVSLSGRPATNGSRFLRQSAHLPPSSAETLRSVAHRARAGLPQFIVAATALYLHRLTSAQDLVLGLPVTGRLGAV